MAVGDFNGDGKLDLAVANYGSNTVSVLLGNGNGAFAAATTYSTGGIASPIALAVGDFNGDGKLDLAVANYAEQHGEHSPGQRLGRVRRARDLLHRRQRVPMSVAVGDFNGDGKLDLAVANRNSDNVAVLLGNGTGTFAAASRPSQRRIVSPSP